MPGERINIVIDATDRTKQAFSSAQKGMGKLRQQINSHSTQIKFAAGAAVASLGFMAKASIESASELEESINAVQVVFGEGSDKILEFGNTAAQSVGLARSEFNQLSAVTGALLQDVGLPMTDVADRTNELAIRAADMASVMNTSVQDALSAVNQALRGETEAIRRYTGDVTDATLEQFRLAEGLAQPVKEMNEQEKRMLRLQLIMKQTDKFAGDYANTSGSLANQQRALAAEFEDVRAKIGEELLPVMRDNVLPFMRESLIPFIQNVLVPALGDFFTGIEVVKDGWNSMTDSIAGVMIKLDKLDRKLQEVGEPIRNFFGDIGSGLGALQNLATTGTLTGRQHGGPLNRGQAALVGEAGPELFVPNTAGTVVPHEVTKQVSVNLGGITINNEADTDRFMRKLSDLLGGQVEANRLGIL